MPSRRAKRAKALPVVLELYATRTRLDDIAEKVGVAPSTILSWLKHYGIALRPRGYCQPNIGALGKVTDEELARLYHSDQQTLQQIGDMFGISRERVRQVMEKRGIKRVNRKRFWR